MVKDLILHQFAVSLSEVSVGRLLHELGLTPQRPLRRGYQQNPVRVAYWLQEESLPSRKKLKRPMQPFISATRPESVPIITAEPLEHPRARLR